MQVVGNGREEAEEQTSTLYMHTLEAEGVRVSNLKPRHLTYLTYADRASPVLPSSVLQHNAPERW